MISRPAKEERRKSSRWACAPILQVEKIPKLEMRKQECGENHGKTIIQAKKISEICDLRLQQVITTYELYKKRKTPNKTGSKFLKRRGKLSDNQKESLPQVGK